MEYHNGASNEDHIDVSPTSIVDYCGEYEIHKVCLDLTLDGGDRNANNRSRCQSASVDNNNNSSNKYIKIGFSLKESEWLDETKRYAFPKQSSYTFVNCIQKECIGYKAGIRYKDILCWPKDNESNMQPIFFHDLFTSLELLSDLEMKKKNRQRNGRFSRNQQNHGVNKWTLISENDFAIRWQDFKQQNKNQIQNEDNNNNEISSINDPSVFHFYIARKIEKYQSTSNDVVVVSPSSSSLSSPCTTTTKTKSTKKKSAVTSAVLTQNFIDSRITSNYLHFSPLVQSRILSDAKVNAKQNYTQAYNGIISALPSSYKERWGQIYFVKWDKHYLPGLVVNPITHVAPGPTRDLWYQNYIHHVQNNSIERLKFIVYWYGGKHNPKQEYYSVVAQTRLCLCTSELMEQYRKTAKNAENKLKCGKKLVGADIEIYYGLREFEKDMLIQVPNQRGKSLSHGFCEVYDSLSYDDLQFFSQNAVKMQQEHKNRGIDNSRNDHNESEKVPCRVPSSPIKTVQKPHIISMKRVAEEGLDTAVSGKRRRNTNGHTMISIRRVQTIDLINVDNCNQEHTNSQKDFDTNNSGHTDLVDKKLRARGMKDDDSVTIVSNTETVEPAISTESTNGVAAKIIYMDERYHSTALPSSAVAQKTLEKTAASNRDEQKLAKSTFGNEKGKLKIRIKPSLTMSSSTIDTASVVNDFTSKKSPPDPSVAVANHEHCGSKVSDIDINNSAQKEESTTTSVNQQNHWSTLNSSLRRDALALTKVFEVTVQNYLKVGTDFEILQKEMIELKCKHVTLETKYEIKVKQVEKLEMEQKMLRDELHTLRIESKKKQDVMRSQIVNLEKEKEQRNMEVNEEKNKILSLKDYVLNNL